MSLVRLFSLSLLCCCPVVDNSESPLTFRSGFLLLRAHQHRFTFVPDLDLKWWWENCKLSLLCWRTLIATYSIVKVSHQRRKSKTRAAERLMAPLCCLYRQAVSLFSCETGWNPILAGSVHITKKTSCSCQWNCLSAAISHVAMCHIDIVSQQQLIWNVPNFFWMFFFYDLLSMRIAHIVVARLWNLSLLLSGLACKIWFASGRNGNFSFFLDEISHHPCSTNLRKDDGETSVFIDKNIVSWETFPHSAHSTTMMMICLRRRKSVKFTRMTSDSFSWCCVVCYSVRLINEKN